MSVSGHRAAAPAGVPCFVLTISDTRSLETDSSGALIVERLSHGGHSVVDRRIVKDDASAVADAVRGKLTGPARAIITTGGTGIAARDMAFEAVSALFEKTLDGFGELFRHLSYQEIGAAAMLSRACAGVAKGRVIFVLPGSEAAVRLAMDRLILPELGHIAGELTK
jgi:molybdenum cofactor biosynthesis protein B